MKNRFHFHETFLSIFLSIFFSLISLPAFANVCHDCVIDRKSGLCPAGTVLMDCKEGNGTAWIRQPAVNPNIGNKCWDGTLLTATSCGFKDAGGNKYCTYNCGPAA